MKRKKKRNLITAELLRVSRLSMEAAELVLPVIRDENLKYQVERQREAYRTAAARSAELLRKNGLDPIEQPDLMERVLRGSIKTDTFWNKSAPHIAQIAIHCTDAAMKDLAKTMNLSADEGTESRKLAEEFLDAGQRNIDLLKQYL
ncbi:hypothetical protein EQM14_08185 [Caproiciproducens sp. NJN-50]|uniref:hypothetical protein n=1 Tax=Acutalibacteraceae TaxID=3082771 RepID=UPI000FFE278C|nr:MULTISPECIES: hypothetical protein [Acutalibacteraceae]QAT49753.1 hypothetical protein EQM14_08185 [Caproiciproducens sp. NJN-50]